MYYPPPPPSLLSTALSNQICSTHCSCTLALVVASVRFQRWAKLWGKVERGKNNYHACCKQADVAKRQVEKLEASQKVRLIQMHNSIPTIPPKGICEEIEGVNHRLRTKFTQTFFLCPRRMLLLLPIHPPPCNIQLGCVLLLYLYHLPTNYHQPVGDSQP
jgi:hypothetical protein